MRLLSSAISLLLISTPLLAQPGKFPPDSLINTQVFPKGTPPIQVIGAMRNFAGGLGVRCQFCHVGEEGKPLETFDFASDQKRTKLVARQMMRMVAEINRRVDTLPGRELPGVQVGCVTCHRGLSKPVTLASTITGIATTSGADSAVRAYKNLRLRYYGRDAYDFSEFSLNSAAFNLGRSARYDDAMKLLALNEEMFPTAATTYLFRGNLYLMQKDTANAEKAFREAVKRDPRSEAIGRLKDIGKQP